MNLLVPRGFRLAGVHCGIKPNTTHEDLTLIVSDQPATAAGVYTQNLVHAPSVGRNRQITPTGQLRAVVANSGNANACTGQRGMQDVHQTARLAARACGAQPDQVLVLSTGVIGVFLPMDKIAAGIAAAAQRLGQDGASLLAAARGMMTTDKFPKLAGRTLSTSAGEVHVTGIAKGAGMIGPRLATMLSVVMTDAALAPAEAQAALAAAADESFNCISVEGHMSTSDTVLLVASGGASAQPLSGSDASRFRAALAEVCIELARKIPEDGEGASHLIQIDVRGCASRQDARQIAQTIANSTLVKTGIAGANPNWGRIVCAAGYSGVRFDPQRVTLSVNGVVLYEAGEPLAFDAKALSQSMRQNRETLVVLQFSEGEARSRFWTSDLTHDYIRLNTDYDT